MPSHLPSKHDWTFLPVSSLGVAAANAATGRKISDGEERGESLPTSSLTRNLYNTGMAFAIQEEKS